MSNYTFKLENNEYKVSLDSTEHKVSLSRTGTQGAKGDSISSVTLDASNHLIVTIVDGVGNVVQTIDAGLIEVTNYAIGNANDVSLTDITDGEILRWDGSDFVNNTHSEADLQKASTLETDVEALLSVNDTGGDGSLTYNSGVFTYTGPSASETQAHFSGGMGVTLASGEISLDFTEFTTDNIVEGATNKFITDERVQDIVGDQLVTNGTHTNLTATYDDSSDGGINLAISDSVIRDKLSVTDAGGDGSLSYDNGTGVISYTGPDSSEVQAHFSAGTNTSYLSGVFDISDTTIRSKLSATDNGGDGSFSYNPTTGAFSYTGPSATEVQAHITGGTGVTVVAGEVAIGQEVETTSDVTFNKVVTNTIEGGSVITIDPAGIGDATGEVIVAGSLIVQGTTTTINSNEVNIGDSIILLNSDETGTPSQDSGIEVERGTFANVTFKWNEATDAWDFGSETVENLVLDSGTF